MNVVIIFDNFSFMNSFLVYNNYNYTVAVDTLSFQHVVYYFKRGLCNCPELPTINKKIRISAKTGEKLESV